MSVFALIVVVFEWKGDRVNYMRFGALYYGKLFIGVKCWFDACLHVGCECLLWIFD